MTDVDTARTGDRVRLTLPAHAAYARLARIGAASVAARWGLPARSVQDLRLAVDEAIIMLLAGRGDRAGHLDIDYVFDEHGLVVEIESHVGADEDSPELTADALDRFRTLAGELLSEYEIGPDRVVLRVERLS